MSVQPSSQTVGSTSPILEMQHAVKSTTQFSLSFPEFTDIKSKLLEKSKLTHYLWNTLIVPLLALPYQTLPIKLTWSFSEKGELSIELDTTEVDKSTFSNLLWGLKHNPRLNIEAEPEKIKITIENHQLPKIFFGNPGLLISVYSQHPHIKKMHETLFGQGDLGLENLLVPDIKEENLFVKESVPGDYIIKKNVSQGFTVFYKTGDNKIHSFAFSGIYGGFSTFSGFEHLKRPFLFKDKTPEEMIRKHNAFLFIKNVAIVKSLSKFAGTDMNNFCIGGIDTLIGLEDLVAWHEFLPSSSIKAELLNLILPYVSLLLAHFNSLQGETVAKEKQVSLQGMRRPPAKEEIASGAQRYLRRSRLFTEEQKEIMFRMLEKTVKFSNKSDFVIDDQSGVAGDAQVRFDQRNKEIISELLHGIPASISTGWSKHTNEDTLFSCPPFGTYMLYTNKGQTLHKDSNTRLYRVTRPISKDKIGHIRKRPNMGPLGEQLGTYFYAPEHILQTVAIQMGGLRPQTMEEEFGLVLIDTIKKKPQKVGNCSVANGKEVFFNGSFFLFFKEFLEKGCSEKDAITQATAKAKLASKEYQLDERTHLIETWGHLSKYLHSEPELAKKHFVLYQMISTKIVNNKQKVENYGPYAAQPGSLVKQQLQEMTTAMGNLVKNSLCDIEMCTGPIPFSQGNRIKKGPNGSFGIYKSRYFGAPNSEEKVQFYLVAKNLKGKFQIMEINRVPAGFSKKYEIDVDGVKQMFNTLGELAHLMEDHDHQLIFAL